MSAPDVILHFASPASPPSYQQYPVETYLANSYATHQLLQYLMAQNPKAIFLFASTSEIYGDPLVHPQTETYWGNVNPNGIRSCYDEAKRLGETICGVHARNYNVDARIVRIFNTYGPRMDLQDGRVIPNFIRAALNRQPLPIYGDGDQTRSYCYVSDLVEGILRFAATPNLAGETINLGNPGEFTINQTVEEMKRVVKELAPQLGEVRTMSQALPADDPTKRQPDISKAIALLNWQPTVDFATGLSKTFSFYLEKQ
jgi:nucleoside-diphosphate-sugar epimerase